VGQAGFENISSKNMLLDFCDCLAIAGFVEVGLQTGTAQGEAEELVVPSEAVQKIGESEVVFIPEEDEPGRFKVRKVELGAEVAGYRRVLAGLKQGDRVVTKGSFTLKAQLMKSQLGEDAD